MLLKQRAKALQGHTKSAGQLLAMWAKREFRDTPPSQFNVTTNDGAIVEDFLRENREAAWASTGTTSTDETAVNASNNDTAGVADDDKKGAKQRARAMGLTAGWGGAPHHTPPHTAAPAPPTHATQERTNVPPDPRAN